MNRDTDANVRDEIASDSRQDCRLLSSLRAFPITNCVSDDGNPPCHRIHAMRPVEGAFRTDRTPQRSNQRCSQKRQHCIAFIVATAELTRRQTN